MVKRFLAIGECMVELADQGSGLFRQGYAGDAYNVAWYARKALPPVWRVGFFTALGDDAISDRMVGFMERSGIDTSHVARLPGRTPGLYMTELKDGERRFHYWRDRSAARDLAEDAEALETALAEAHALYFSGITLAILTPDARGRLLSALGRAKARGATVAFDSHLRPRLWSDPGAMRAAIRAAARVATIALPTVPDEAALFGEADAEAVARRYVSDGCPEVAVRTGAGKALLVWPGGQAALGPGIALRPVDTTGAGDCFSGTYLAGRLVGLAPEAAAEAAHAAAGMAIQGSGALV